MQHVILGIVGLMFCIAGFCICISYWNYRKEDMLVNQTGIIRIIWLFGMVVGILFVMIGATILIVHP